MLKYKNFNVEIKQFNDEEYTIDAIFSTADPDRQGEVVAPDSWIIEEYLTNPVVLFAHDHWQPAVAQIKDFSIDEQGNMSGTVKFAAAEYDFAKTLYLLYKGKYMRAFSVGFECLESETVGEGTDSRVILKKNKLYEISVVNVGANAFALAKESLAAAKTKGLDTEAVEKLIKDKEEKDIKEKEIDKIDHEKPYPNEHACRLRNPDDFQEDTFRRTTREHEGKEYTVIMAKLKNEDTMTDQAFRYNKEKWTAEEAKTHCADHDGSFEAASGKCLSCIKKKKVKKNIAGVALVLKALNNLLDEDAGKMNSPKRVVETPEQGRRKRAKDLINRAMRLMMHIKKGI